MAAKRSRASLSRSTASALRSEEHTSELQSRQYLVCRLLLEKKKTKFLTPLTQPSRIPGPPSRGNQMSFNSIALKVSRHLTCPFDRVAARTPAIADSSRQYVT